MAPTPGSVPTAQDTDNRAPAAGQAGGLTPGGGGVRNFGNQRRMISELERINALNLEPSLPKVDDGNRAVMRHNQDRDKVKNEFQQFLSVMKKNDEAKAGTPSAGSSNRKADGGGQMSQVQKPSVPGTTSSQPNLILQPTFSVEIVGPTVKKLGDILDGMLRQASSTPTHSMDPDWPEAKGASYHEVLGRPTGPAGSVPDPKMVAQDVGSRQGPAPQGNNARPPMQQPQDQSVNQMRPMGPPQQMPQGMPQQQQGYVMAPTGPQQGGGQQPMQFMMPGMGQGPQGMQPMQGMPQMQGQTMVFGQPPQMFAPGPNQQGGGMPMGAMMMAAPTGGGPNPQGVMQPMNQQQFDGQQQQQQMMFMPVMMTQDQSGNFMPAPQGMQGYPGQQGGGNPQQGAFMMQQPMYNQQANSG